MWLNKQVKSELKTLEELENELAELMSTIRPSDKLKRWDEFIIEKEIVLPWWEVIPKDSIIRVLKVKDTSKERSTIEIKYEILWQEWEVKSMSKWVFIWYFCKELDSSERKFDNKRKLLEGQIKSERDKIERGHLEQKVDDSWNEKAREVMDDVNDEIHFLLKFIKNIRKKRK